MKKILSIILSLTLLMGMSVTAFAESTTSGSQTVSVDISTPCYDYTLHIPADCKIDYDKTEPQSIGSVTVTSDYWDNITTDYHGVLVNIKYNSYLSDDEGNKIYFLLGNYDNLNIFSPKMGEDLGWFIEYKGDGVGVDGYEGNLYMEVFDWSNAQPGKSYSVTITYTSELLVRH